MLPEHQWINEPIDWDDRRKAHEKHGYPVRIYCEPRFRRKIMEAYRGVKVDIICFPLAYASLLLYFEYEGGLFQAIRKAGGLDP